MQAWNKSSSNSSGIYPSGNNHMPQYQQAILVGKAEVTYQFSADNGNAYASSCLAHAYEKNGMPVQAAVYYAKAFINAKNQQNGDVEMTKESAQKLANFLGKLHQALLDDNHGVESFLSDNLNTDQTQCIVYVMNPHMQTLNKELVMDIVFRVGKACYALGDEDNADYCFKQFLPLSTDDSSKTEAHDNSSNFFASKDHASLDPSTDQARIDYAKIQRKTHEDRYLKAREYFEAAYLRGYRPHGQNES